MLSETRVSQEKLLATLKENRTKHVAEYNDAVVAFREEASKELRSLARSVAAEGELKTSIGLPVPRSYEDQYDRAIAMVEWSEDETITLDETDFAAFVLDQWGWSGQFAAQTSIYNAGKAR